MVEADPVMQRHLGSLLSAWGYEPVLTSTVDESLAALAHNTFVFSLLDLNLDGADAINEPPIAVCSNGYEETSQMEQSWIAQRRPAPCRRSSLVIVVTGDAYA